MQPALIGAALAAALTLASAGARANDAERRSQIEAELAEAIGSDDDARALTLLDELLAIEGLSPRRRQWALRTRIFKFDRLGLVCEGEAAATAYLGLPDVRRQGPQENASVLRAGRSMARACERLRVKAGPPGPDEAEPVRGQGTLTVSSGVFDLGVDPRRIHTAFEGSMGMRWRSRLQLEGAVGLYIESPVLVVARPGLRLTLFEPAEAVPVQLRLALQVAFGGRLAAAFGALGGLAVGVALGRHWGIQTAADLSVWPEHRQLAAEGRIGVFYGF